MVTGIAQELREFAESPGVRLSRGDRDLCLLSAGMIFGLSARIADLERQLAERS